MVLTLIVRQLIKCQRPCGERLLQQGGLRKKLEDVIPNLKERSDKLYKQFNMQFFFKNIETENEDAAFLFQDIHSITISNKDNKNKIARKREAILHRIDDYDHELLKTDFKSNTITVHGSILSAGFFCLCAIAAHRAAKH